jgi:hypothetical protein
VGRFDGNLRGLSLAVDTGDLGKAVQQLKWEPGKGLFVGGVKLPLALADLGLIDEYEFVVQPILAGAVALRYQPSRVTA